MNACAQAPQVPGHWSSAYVLSTTVAILIAALVAAACGGGMAHAVQIGGDEHYEVMKGLLWAKGCSLYTQVWNDQPPLFTVFLGVLFKIFGCKIAVARGLASFFGAGLVTGLFHCVRRASGVLAAVVAAFCLVAAPEVFRLTVSAMLEVPAIGVGLWALWPVWRWEECGRKRWLVLSGLIMAVALQIKLTAAIMGPALAVEIVVTSLGRAMTGRGRRAGGRGSESSEVGGQRTDSQSLAGDSPRSPGGSRRLLVGGWGIARDVLTWAGSMAAGFIILGLLFGSGYREAWQSHFAAKPASVAAQIDRLAFSPELLVQHTEALWGVGAALVVLVWKRSLRPVLFPLVLLATVLVVHLIHRPYWPYYYLHFAVPIAWLTGYGVAEFCKAAWQGTAFAAAERRAGSVEPGAGAQGQGAEREGPESGSEWPDAKGQAQGGRGRAWSGRDGGWKRWRRRLAGWAVLLAAAVLVSVVESYGGLRLYDEIQEIRALPRTEGNPIITAMRRYASRTHWVYTKATMYPFDAGLPVIPELAVLPLKRYWSGQITERRILAILKEYRPEQILLTSYGATDPKMREFVKDDYAPVCQDSGYTLYIAKGLAGARQAARRRYTQREK